MPEYNVLLKGVVGSQAYGMATTESDTDYYGVFAYSTFALTGLHLPKPTVEQHDPDLTMHEAAKYCKLAIGCNPSVLDLLWLEEYEEQKGAAGMLGAALVDIRDSFLSSRRVKDAYLGYATQQFKRITMRGDNSFSADTRKRTAKHARHLLRLCETGYQLWATGQMRLRVTDPQALFDFGERVAGGDLGVAAEALSKYSDKFRDTPTVLPKNPNERLIERWLLEVRIMYCR